jgi:hypothetical protein
MSDESRRSFLKKAGIATGLSALSGAVWGEVLAQKIAVEHDAALIKRAAVAVDKAARAGKPTTLAAAYRRLKGRNAQVLDVLESIDARLSANRALEKFDQALIDKSIQEGIVHYVDPRVQPGGGGQVASKGSRLYQVPDSAARLMFDQGGTPLKELLTKRGVQIAGYNK